MKKSTVSVKEISGHPALNMKMGGIVESVDMQYAYLEIDRYLETVDHNIFIVVDLTENDGLPYQATLSGALFGPFTNPKVEQWLVVGDHRLGKNIAKALTKFTNKSHIKWFNTCDECLAYIE